MLELIILIFGLLSVFIFIRFAYKDIELVHSFILSIGVFFSIVAIYSYYSTRYGIPIFSIYITGFFLISSVAMGAIAKNTIKKINLDKDFFLGSLFLIIIGMISFLSTSLPSLFPLSRNHDSVFHFNIIQYIIESNALYPDSYPYGFHAVSALVIKSFEIDTIIMLYPIVIFILVLTALVIYGIVVDLKLSDKLFGLLPPSIVLAFFMTNYMTTVMGWWPMLFGILLVLIFAWLLIIYQNESNRYGIVLLAIVEAGVIFSYSFWAVVPALLFISVIMLKDWTIQKKIGTMFLFSFLVTIMTFDYIIALLSYYGIMHTGIVYFLPFDIFNWRIGTPVVWRNILNIGLSGFFMFSIFAAILIGIRDKKNKFIVLFFGIVLLQVITFAVGVKFLNFDVYPYAKAYYLLIYPASIFIFIGLNAIVKRFNLKIKKTRLTNIVFILGLILLVFLSVHAMSFGIKATGHQEAVLTPDQYDVAQWVKSNISNNNFTVFGVTPHASWFYSVSGRGWEEIYEDPQWDVAVSDFKRWELGGHDIPVVLGKNRIDGDDIAILLDKNKFDVDFSRYKILYEKGDVIVLSK